MPAVTTSAAPLRAGRDNLQQVKTSPYLQARTLRARPLSEATEILDTDIEDESEFEGSEFEEDPSPKRSFESVSQFVPM